MVLFQAIQCLCPIIVGDNNISGKLQIQRQRLGDSLVVLNNQESVFCHILSSFCVFIIARILQKGVTALLPPGPRKTGGTHKWSTACCNFVVLAAPHPSRLGRGAFPGGEGLGFIRGYAAARGPCP